MVSLFEHFVRPKQSICRSYKGASRPRRIRGGGSTCVSKWETPHDKLGIAIPSGRRVQGSWYESQAPAGRHSRGSPWAVIGSNCGRDRSELVDRIKDVLKPIVSRLPGRNNESTRSKWIERTLREIPKGSRILDAGCGEQQFRRFC
jgi:hypothetical protein